MPILRCVGCGHVQESSLLDPVCERCSSAVVLADSQRVRVEAERFEEIPLGVWRYSLLLPVVSAGTRVTLGEGGTPLLPARRLGAELGLENLLLKDESRNPTGSFIDRGATVLVSLAKSRGVKECTCVTTGNLGASLAAYCAKAGIAARVRIHPSTDRGKLYQMIAYGAEIEVPHGGSQPTPSGSGSLSVTAANPFLLEGEKTTCFEIVQELGWKTPDAVVVPVGTGGHLSMFWKAVAQLREAGLTQSHAPRLFGVQLKGSVHRRGAPASRSGLGGHDHPYTELEDSEPFFAKEASRAVEDSRGARLVTTAAETLAATGLLARTEGIFAEPASASVIASLRDAVGAGLVHRDDVVVCVVTGSGLKDTRAISRLMKEVRRVSVREDTSAARMQFGQTKIALLELLAARPRYGYELWLELRTGRSMTTASVYQHLSELERLGIVRKSGVVTRKGRERILYEPTRKGADILKLAGKIERAGLPGAMRSDAA